MIQRRSKKRNPEDLVPEEWEILTEIEVNGKILGPGDRFTVTGEPGAEFRFIRHVTNRKTSQSWVDCVGGVGQARPTTAVTMFRAFRLERISRILKPIVPRRRKAA